MSWPWSSKSNIPNLLDDLDSLETGDLLLFHGEGFWFSWVVEWATWSEFSHVAIILKDPTYLDPKLKGIYMLESGTEKFPDAVEHKIHFGVQVVNLEKVIEYYTGKIYYRKLTVPNSYRINFSTQLNKIWDNIKDAPYDYAIWDFFRTEFGLDWGNMNRTNKFFCSALVTFCYERFKILEQDIPWDLITPENFNQGKKIDSLLIESCTLGPKIKLK